MVADMKCKSDQQCDDREEDSHSKRSVDRLVVQARCVPKRRNEMDNLTLNKCLKVVRVQANQMPVL